MRKILLAAACAAALGAFAGIHDVGPGTMAVTWADGNGAELAAETSEERVVAFVADDASARALLAQVKGAYETDPLVLCQVAAVSQWVMTDGPCWLLFWKPSPSAGRKVWVKALLETAEAATDPYVKTVCLDQLRWCGCDCPKVVSRIQAIGEKGGKSVADFAEVVIRELTGKSIGL